MNSSTIFPLIINCRRLPFREHCSPSYRRLICYKRGRRRKTWRVFVKCAVHWHLSRSAKYSICILRWTSSSSGCQSLSSGRSRLSCRNDHTARSNRCVEKPLWCNTGCYSMLLNPICFQTLLMDLKYNFPVRFPFNPSVICLEDIEIPESLKLPMLEKL